MRGLVLVICMTAPGLLVAARCQSKASCRAGDVETSREQVPVTGGVLLTVHCMPVDLATNPYAASVNRIALKQVQGRIDRVHKALDLLAKRDRDSESRWAELHEEMVEQSHEIDKEALIFMTAGLGELLKEIGSTLVEGAIAAKDETVWAEIPVEKERLQAMLTSARGEDAEQLRRAIAAFDELQRAEHFTNKVETANKLREAMLVETEALQRLHETDRRSVDTLYFGALYLGKMALILGKDLLPAAGSAAVTEAGLVEPFAEATAVYARMEQEESEMNRLAAGGYDRQTERRALQAKLGELEQQRQTFQWAVQHADATGTQR